MNEEHNSTKINILTLSNRSGVDILNLVLLVLKIINRQEYYYEIVNIGLIGLKLEIIKVIKIINIYK